MRRRTLQRAVAGVTAVLSLVTGLVSMSTRAWPAPGTAGAACPAVTNWPLPSCPKASTPTGTGQPSAGQPSAGQPSAGQPGAAPHADPAGGDLTMKVANATETAQGSAMTGPLAGSDYVRVHGMGTVARMTAAGRTVWERDSGSFYADWKLHWTGPPGYVPTPEMVGGIDPADPFQIAAVGDEVVHDTKPYAVGDLNGDGVPDVAVTHLVGVDIGLSCRICGWPFTVPGSNLHVGTFVTVLDGRDGHTLYSEVDPGFVTHVVIAGHTLVVGDVTGSPQGRDPMGRWGSATVVRGLTMRPAGRRLTPARTWTYSTHAEWAQLFGLDAVGGDRVSVAWSDTPLGLGTPGPPDGHVVMLDGEGRVRWDVRTAGYPTLTGYDPGRRQLAVVEQTDPIRDTSYTLDGLRVADGRAVTRIKTANVLPTTLTVADRGTGWLVGGVSATPAQVRPPYYTFTAGLVTAADPDRGRVRWSATLAPGSSPFGPVPPEPGTVVVTAARRAAATVVAGSWENATAPSPSRPIENVSDLQALSVRDGAPRWDHTGDPADPLSLSTAGRPAPSTVTGVTAAQDVVTYDTGTGTAGSSAPLMADLYDAVAAHKNPDGVDALVAGGQSGAVYAFDPRRRAGDGRRKVLWQANLPGPVHQIVLAKIGGRSRLVVAATTCIAVIDLRSGRIQSTIPLPGQYAWNVAVGDLGGGVGTGFVVATDRLTVYDGSGRQRWTFRPATTGYFSNAAISGGAVVAEYQNQVPLGGKPTTMAAVGIDANTGTTLWTAAADPATTHAPQLYNGVIADPAIPGAGPHPAAFAWQAANGQGRIDVRDARTGALHYSNSSDSLDNHRGYVADPAVGLVAVGQRGSVSIRPAGPVAQPILGAADATVAKVARSTVYLTASAQVEAYPSAVLGSTEDPSPLAAYDTFLTWRIVAAAGWNGSPEVIALPQDWLAWRVVTFENGLNSRPYAVTVERGLTELTLGGTPPAAAARRPAPPHPAAPQAADTVTAPPGPAGLGIARPLFEVKVHGHDRVNAPLLSSGTPGAYTPAMISAYLGLRGDGSGQTVAVVDADQDHTIAADVDRFSAQFGLPRPCGAAKPAGTGCFDFTTQLPDGPAGTNENWALETALDVEWIHAVAPKAAVRLYEARDDSFASLFRAVDVAAAGHPAAISLSWGIQGEFTDETYYDRHCRLSGSLCVFASGDDGHPGSSPAYTPHALAVGGTTLRLDAAGKPLGETAWAGSGGGRSYVQARPPYQRRAVSGRHRGIPDVAFDADPQTGVAVYDGTPLRGQAGWFQVGGTSLGAPAWSAVLAAADQLRAAKGKPRLADGTAQSDIYAASRSLGDIITGPANGLCPGICQAGPGYDYVTGLGSPRPGLDSALAASR